MNYLSIYGVAVQTDPFIIGELKATLQRGEVFYGELLGLRKSGAKYWNLLRIAPARDHAGRLTHYVGIQTDITLVRQKDLEIKEQREELLHVTRVGKMSEFVSALAHEISQPLTAILSYTQAARRMLANREPQIRKILKYIHDDDIRATEVISRLRSLLKKSVPEIKKLDINALVKDTVVIMATDATMRETILKTDLAPNLPRVNGDRIQLQQVLLNLISNSFEAMEKSHICKISIRTSRKDSNTITVAVKDTGSGISAENMPKLFVRFFTSKPDGLGMGLSISRSIIEMHGGCLEVENNKDRGVTFHFSLPIAGQEAQ
jgi:two-component system sensor kinase FixL